MEVTAATAGAAASVSSSSNDALRDLDLDDFLGLLIAELQHQDPLSPLENSEILAQISQIREIGATTKLDATLESVLFGQSVTNAASLIGKEVKALDDDGGFITGQVEKVTIAGNEVQVHVGEHEVKLNNVSEILA